MIDASTSLYALLGQRLPYTLSPQIHNSLFARAGNHCVYIPLQFEPFAMGDVLATMRACFAGFNITIPYKELVLPYLDEVDETVAACKACNTVRVGRTGDLCGFNTDGEGFLQALREALIVPGKGFSAVILGAGGAARCIAYALLTRGAAVTVACRDIRQGGQLVDDLALACPGASLDVTGLDDIAGEHELLVNATPVGTTPKTDECLVVPRVLERFEAVFDAVYQPSETKLLRMASDMGLKTVGGFAMLYYQACAAQERWLLGDACDRQTTRRLYAELRRTLDQ